MTIQPGPCHFGSLNDQIKRSNIEEGCFTEAKYPYFIKPDFSLSDSNKENSSNATGSEISFVHDDSIRDLLGFDSVVKNQKYTLSPNPVDIISFDKKFLETDTAQKLTFGDRRSGIIHEFAMAGDLGYKYIRKISAGLQW